MRATVTPGPIGLSNVPGDGDGRARTGEEGEGTVGGHILLVEDDAGVGELIADILGGEGYRITVAPTERAALAALAAARYDLVLSDALADLELGEGRWAAVGRIRAAAGPTPVVICTAHHPRHFADFAARGFSGLIRKPFDLDDLVAPVARLIACRAQAADGAGGAIG